MVASSDVLHLTSLISNLNLSAHNLYALLFINADLSLDSLPVRLALIPPFVDNDTKCTKSIYPRSIKYNCIIAVSLAKSMPVNNSIDLDPMRSLPKSIHNR